MEEGRRTIYCKRLIQRAYLRNTMTEATYNSHDNFVNNSNPIVLLTLEIIIY